MRLISVPALEALGADLPTSATDNGLAELVAVEPQGVSNGHGPLLETVWSVPTRTGHRREAVLLLDQQTFKRIAFLPEPPGKPIAGYNLDRLGDQIAAGDLGERDVYAWTWVYGSNRGRPFTFNWSDRDLFVGGPDSLLRALSTLQRLGWISTSETAEGDCTVTPTPGRAAIRK